jgi:hypothetical protein
VEDHRFDGVTYLQPNEAVYFLIRPTAAPTGNQIPAICDVMLAVARDFSHVLIGGGFWAYGGYEGLARKVDAVELEALAERFPNVPELRRVLANQRG